MWRIKEWWDALDEKDRALIHKTEGWHSTRDLKPGFCRICGRDFSLVDDFSTSVECWDCRKAYISAINKANEAIVKIAREFFHEELVYTFDGKSHWVPIWPYENRRDALRITKQLDH